MKLRNLSLLVFLSTISGLVHASEPAVSNTWSQGIANLSPDQRALMQYKAERLSAPIKSRADLERYLAANSGTPLDKLPPSVRANFINSLVFRKEGLASFSSAGLGNFLSISEIYKLLGLFGMQSATSGISNLPRPSNELESFISLMPQQQPVQKNMWCVQTSDNRFDCKLQADESCDEPVCSSPVE